MTPRRFGSVREDLVIHLLRCPVRRAERIRRVRPEEFKKVFPVIRRRKAVFAEPDGLAAALEEQGIARVGGDAVRLDNRPVMIEIRIAQLPPHGYAAARPLRFIPRPPDERDAIHVTPRGAQRDGQLVSAAGVYVVFGVAEIGSPQDSTAAPPLFIFSWWSRARSPSS